MREAAPVRAVWLAIVAIGGAAAALALALAWPAANPAGIGTQAVLSLAGVLGAWLAVPAAYLAGRGSRAGRAKMSADLDAVSRRLLRVEERADVLPPAQGAASSPLDDMVEDIGSLSRVVKDLAEAAAGHERAIAALGTAARPPPEPAEADQSEAVPPEAVVPSFFPVREPAAAAPAAPSEPERKSRAGYASILDALEGERIDLHVQPIVSLPQRQVRFYESFALLQTADGEALVPSEFMPTLERLRRLPRLDALVVDRALAAARRIKGSRRPMPISCNLSALSLGDPDFLAALDTLLAGEPVERRLIFEMSQRAWRDADPNVLARCREGGIAVSLHQVEDFELDADLLARRGVRYVKIAARTILEAQDRAGGARDVAKSPQLFAGSGVDLIAEFVEDDAIVPELIDLEIPLAQGYAFALPCPASAVFSTGTEIAAALRDGMAADGPAPDVAAKPESRPLREFLRRAG